MILNDEEIDNAYRQWQVRKGKQNLKISWKQWLAKAQARKIFEWGNEPCPHNPNTSEEIEDENGNVIGERLYPKRKCDACWSELQKEIEG